MIEAALEDLELKRTIFRALDAEAPPDAILATNTSALSIAAIAASTARPERVLGLHFFNPAPVMRLVEVVRRAADVPAVAARAATSSSAGAGRRSPAPDSPGFIVNRVNRPFTIEALADPRGRARRPSRRSTRRSAAAGYPMGPFELMDLTGIDVTLAAATRRSGRVLARPDRFRPSPIQESWSRRGGSDGRRATASTATRTAAAARPTSAGRRRPPEARDRSPRDRAGDPRRGVAGSRRRASPREATSTARCGSGPAIRRAVRAGRSGRPSASSTLARHRRRSRGSMPRSSSNGDRLTAVDGLESAPAAAPIVRQAMHVRATVTHRPATVARSGPRASPTAGRDRRRSSPTRLRRAQPARPPTCASPSDAAGARPRRVASPRRPSPRPGRRHAALADPVADARAAPSEQPCRDDRPRRRRRAASVGRDMYLRIGGAGRSPTRR